MSKEQKQAEIWKTWTGALSEAARKALQHKEPPALPVETSPTKDDEETDAYHKFRMSLSLEAREWLDNNVDTTLKPDEEIDTSVARFGIVEGPDGDWPMMRLYKTPEALARRVGQLEGEDMVLWCFFGLPIQITRGPQRFLLLPGGTQAVTIPLIEGGPCKVVPADLLDGVEIQDDGFIGPPELANTKLVMAKLEPAKKKKASSSADDDEDDDEEDAGEAGVD